MKGLLISIFGPDGSGKSTQARLLANHLKKRGLKVKIVWVKSYHTIAYVISRIIAKISPHQVTLNPYGHIIRINLFNNSSINRKIWAWIEYVSIIPPILFKVLPQLLTGRIVVAERFIPDSIASIAYTINDPKFVSTLQAKLMLKLIPKNAILIYLDAPYEEIKKRRGALTDPEDYIEFQRQIYDKLSKILKTIRIDTSCKNIEETAKIIRNTVYNELIRRNTKIHAIYKQ